MKFENTQVWGFEHALRGMRNPLESWSKNDSKFLCGDCKCKDCAYCLEHEAHSCGHEAEAVSIGENDLKLAQKLVQSGGEHSKFMRMIHVAVDINMPRYWWSEADTYHFNTKNSCSTMHRLLNNNKPITKDLFVTCEEDEAWWALTINKLEELRQRYKNIQSTTRDAKEMNKLLVRAKRMLPEGFLQMRTLDTNYAELRNMYFQRRNHRLKEEWTDAFCKWVESLPYAKELIMYEIKKPKVTKEEKNALIELITNEQIKHMIPNDEYETEKYTMLEELKVKVKGM